MGRTDRARFSRRSIRLLYGPRAQRLAAFREPAFFAIVSYEQVISDADDINAILRPDVVVLDEAHRIKNWQTKTARRVKSLRAPHAFVQPGPSFVSTGALISNASLYGQARGLAEPPVGVVVIARRLLDGPVLRLLHRLRQRDASARRLGQIA
jgi:hypothetical protein